MSQAIAWPDGSPAEVEAAAGLIRSRAVLGATINGALTVGGYVLKKHGHTKSGWLLLLIGGSSLVWNAYAFLAADSLAATALRGLRR